MAAGGAMERLDLAAYGATSNGPTPGNPQRAFAQHSGLEKGGRPA